MKRGPLCETAHSALSSPDKNKVRELLAAVNLTDKEREIIIKSELKGIGLETVCNSLKSWGKEGIISYSHLCRLKKDGMGKIARYIADNNITIK